MIHPSSGTKGLSIVDTWDSKRRRRKATPADDQAATLPVEPRVIDLETASAHLPLPIRFASRRLGLRHWVTVRRVSN